MTKRLLFIAAALVAAAAFTASAQAGTAPSPGCKGVTNALAQADFSKGKAALTTVAEKLGCSTTPPVVDTLACQSGSELATWAAEANGTREEYGYTLRLVNWVKTGGSGDARPTYAEHDGGGYWESSVAVTGWVLQSNTGQVVWVPNTGSPTGGTFNQNSFDPDVLGGRTGIQIVRFCG